MAPVLIPDAAILDAELTLELPPYVTVATGIDAMVDSFEAYMFASANNHPVSRVLARAVMRFYAQAW